MGEIEPLEGYVGFALLLDGQGGARPLSGPALMAWRPEDGFLWLHLRAEHPAVADRLTRDLGLEPLYRDALLDDLGHPRCIPLEVGLLLVLRTLAAEPVNGSTRTLGLWLEARRAVTVSQGDTPVLTRLRDQLDAGAGPALAGEFPAALLHLLGATYRERLKGLSEHAERLQERIYDSQSRDVQSRLSLLRRHAGRLGGLLDDSRCLTDELLAQELSWLEGKPHKGIRAQRDHLHRLLGEMRDLREHLHSLQDELNGLLDHRLNQRVYLLTVISGVCFPLVFITGLLGVNVGGIPGANSPYAFWFLCLILAVLGLSGGWLLRRRHWF